MRERINGRFHSQIDWMEGKDYHVEINDNYYFLQRIVSCLKGERTKEEISVLVKQLEKRMDEINNEIKSKQGREGYSGLTIRK